ncbi:hypothetical protein BJ997_001663 [Cryobacterium roopkundense]|uniref:Uncharacterized protein n=1 Tax=Cryobacterium roopkundense TaxID=1001240 RepID=A0A7W8ZW64_9MICO|nr:hypothetical protein [Cryobacterium roopkundense]
MITSLPGDPDSIDVLAIANLPILWIVAVGARAV